MFDKSKTIYHKSIQLELQTADIYFYLKGKDYHLNQYEQHLVLKYFSYKLLPFVYHLDKYNPTYL